MIEESQGTNFNLLLKTVRKSPNIPNDEVTNFKYNSSGQLTEITFQSTDASTGKPYKTTETFFRNASGKIDSISFKIASEGQSTNYSKTSFYYNAAGNTSYSVYTNYVGYVANAQIVTIDSSVYSYAGNQIAERTDYRKCCSNPYNLFRTFYYNYDAAGNLTRFISSYTTHPILDTVFYTFDSKPYPIPALRNIDEVFYWAPAFYDDYSFVNSPLSRRNPNSDNFDYEYRYAPNNKSVYQKITDNGFLVRDVYFYYD